MTEHQSSRTLVKSAPELWAECSDAASLARHLGAFGEIRITRLEPETTVAWEGAAACGTVELAPAGWGTRVTLTVEVGEAGPPHPVVTAVPAESPDGVLAAVPAESPDRVLAEAQAESPDGVLTEAQAESADRVLTEGQAGPPDDGVTDEAAPSATPETAASSDRVAQRPRGLARLFARWRTPAQAEQPSVPESLGPPAEPPGPPAEPSGPLAESVVVVVPEPPGDVGGTEPEVGSESADPPAGDPTPPGPAHPLDENLLAAALDSLGRAHHRPYSRS